MKAGRWDNTFTSSVSPLVTTDVEAAGEEEVIEGDEDVPGLWDPDTEDEGGHQEEDTDDEDHSEHHRLHCTHLDTHLLRHHVLLQCLCLFH